MAVLPQKLPWELAQTTWAQAINPTLSNPLNNASILQSVQLSSGANVVNHKLGKKLQGWYVIRMRSVAAAIYDTQDANQFPELTLNLNSSTAVVVDIAVF